MCEQLEKIDREQQLDSVVKDYCASLLSFDADEQNYILMSLRDVLYTRRLHEMEELEVTIANKITNLQTLKKCNAEISHSKL